MKNPSQIILNVIASFLSGVIVLPSAAMAQSQPSVASPSSATPVSANISQPKFGDMNIHDRNAYLKEVEKQDFPIIMQTFLDAGRVEHDDGKQDMVRRILSGAMRERTPPPAFLAQLKAFIEDGSNTIRERDQMIAALGDAATVESESLLISEARVLTDKSLKDSAIGEIGGLGDLSDNENLAPPLNQLWLESKDQQMLMSVSLSMAKISAPSSINLLLSAALASARLDNTHKRLAKEALTTVYRKNAVPSLAAALANQSSTSPQAVLAFSTLAQNP